MNKNPHKISETYETALAPDSDLGPSTGGQSGDTQGLSDVAEASSESVKELTEEGQFFEAEIVDAIENAPDADVAEVRTRQVREDDIPPEYLDAGEPESDRG